MTTINHNDWTLFDDQGYIEQHGVEVHDCEDGTVRIGRTLHNRDDLIISDTRIESRLAKWRLER